MTRATSILFLGIFSSACLTPKTTDTQTEDSGDTDVVSSGATIADIQQGIIGDGEEVFIAEAVITSGMNYDSEGFYVQDPGGGEWSGIYVYTATMAGEFNPFIGDVISISGSVSEFYDFTELKVSSAENISVVGEQAPVSITVSNVSDWEPYESSLITIENVSVLSDFNTYGEQNTDAGVVLKKDFIDFESNAGASFDSVTGVLPYLFGEFKLCPRMADDLVGYVPGEGGGDPVVSKITDLQTGVVALGTIVTVEGAVVTAVSDDGKRIVIQAPEGGINNGIMLYVPGNENNPAGIAIGDEISVTGDLEEYETDGSSRTNLFVSDATTMMITGTGTAEVTALTEDPADWEPYEGILVSIENVTLTSEASQYGSATLSPYSVKIDDSFYDWTTSLQNGQTLQSITGVVDDYYGYVILPRTSADLVE